MDETPINDDEVEGPQPSAEVEEEAQPEATAGPAVADLEGLAKGKEPWRGGGGCSSRLTVYGCLAGLVLLVAMLIVGTSMVRRTVWINMDRGRRLVVQSLPHDLPAAERQRTIRNLDRFRLVLEASKDPYPTMGDFMNRVRDMLEDGRFTAEEVGGLNVYLERVIEESGIPPMQLAFRISNFELRICLSAFMAPGGRMGNPKFEISNSNYAFV
ncbi:MAG: hypothetical protein P8127_02470 [Acidobacteriota bacterium]|jgi:hypothetical protein